jgi:hypothetical protein
LDFAWPEELGEALPAPADLHTSGGRGCTATKRE